ncbi:MAG: 3'(2'),5'-bisphosphate nucleotidase CysQ [Candidatus Anammoxibacter sp.]
MIPKNINILDVLKIAVNAGENILQVYEKDFTVEFKADNSPLTMADKESDDIITGGLMNLYPEIPLLSEESKEVPYEERKSWEYFWLIDPLDGTKEFVKKNGEFTVNIALIFNGKPLLGVIYVPVKDTLYFGLEGAGSYKLANSKELDNCNNSSDVIAASQKLPIDNASKPYTIVGSRSHMSDETQEFIKKKEAEHGNVEIMSIGSSLKLCMVAEGKADIYPRFGPTMEWDTAAGQAIVVYADGNVLEVENNKSLEYNKENLLNPWFIAGRE